MEKSKGALEAEISKLLTQWEKDFLSRGSISVKTDVLRDMIIVNLRGILTPAEYKVCETKEGMLSIKRMRSDLVECGVEELKRMIAAITEKEVLSFHTDISTKTGERVMVFKLDSNLEKSFTTKE
ncbi:MULTISPECIES: DUF2294 domain-containing protein [Sutcliffiella]|uniref:Na+-translocating membrane potential-generating system MpsC domain-containing protein n=1 Tax=Sutcliffiella cohnii TaxID=33932 RepID=A0A223KQ65_9BACI|nr:MULTISPECIES: DUF2294 domain-containing protein [Sutcliffiella]AST91622.1 hypothetical protein BC6307_10180 [Sutcliffiella cohnii]MED4014794.1 DUF2294 domain-containing protein [Sutcliffiella cohnii]WBL17455.1 DUF2294 domain-containing protein [Sutcliffiella sp. NC1]